MLQALTRFLRRFSVSDRRRAARYRVAHGARLLSACGAEQATRVLDVSLSGVRLVSAAPLEVDAAADLLLHFQGEALPCRGRVVRCAPEAYGGWEIALHFLPGGRESSGVLGRYLDFARWLSGHLACARV